MSIYKREGKTGTRWVAVVDGPRDPQTGRRKQVKRTFATKKAAESWEREQRLSVERGTFIKPDAQTVEEYVQFWLDTNALHKVRPTTFRSYEQIIRLHITPALGSITLQKLTPATLQAFYGDKLTGGRTDGKQGGLPPRSVKYIHMIVRQALHQAVKWQLLSRNVADAVEPPRATRAQVQTWDAEDAGRFLQVAADDKYNPVWLLALTTGMRRGELLGVRWHDIDLEKSVLHVRRSLVEVNGRVMFQELKTASSRRAVALSPAAITALREHRTKLIEQRIRIGPAWSDNDLVFSTGDGGPITPANLRRSFLRIVKAAGVPAIRFHDLRHTHATLLLKEGMHAKIVSERLGHANIAITLDTYSHVLPSMQQQAAEGIDRALFGT